MYQQKQQVSVKFRGLDQGLTGVETAQVIKGMLS